MLTRKDSEIIHKWIGDVFEKRKKKYGFSRSFLFIQKHIAYHSYNWKGPQGKSTCDMRLLAVCGADRYGWLSCWLDVFFFCYMCPFCLWSQISLSLCNARMGSNRLFIVAFLIGRKPFFWSFIFLPLSPRKRCVGPVEFRSVLFHMNGNCRGEHFRFDHWNKFR